MRGFTLVELVTVIILIGILSVTAAVKINSSNDEEIHACKDAVITLNLVKNFNINQGVDSDIFFIVKKSGYYGYCQESNCSDPSKWISSKIVANVTSDKDVQIIFNRLGQYNDVKSTGGDFSFISNLASCNVSVNTEGAILWK